MTRTLRAARLALRCLHLFIVDVALLDWRLFWRVYEVARREGVVTIPWAKPHVRTCAARTVLGDYDARHDVVRMFPGHHRDPWVLAHEFGHRVAIRARSDYSEAAADGEGRKILLSTLSPTERRAVLWRVDAVLPENPMPALERILCRARKIRALATGSTNVYERAIAHVRLREIEPAEARAQAMIGQRPRRDPGLFVTRRTDLFTIGIQVAFLVPMLRSRSWWWMFVPIVILAFLLAMYSLRAKWTRP